MKKQNDMRIFCGFDKTKPTIDKIINDVFGDYVEKKNIAKNGDKDRQNKNSTLKLI